MTDSNNKLITKDNLLYTEIFHTYKTEKVGGKNKMVSSAPKFDNSVGAERLRPTVHTDYVNMFRAGAHTRTKMNIHNMEGAVESGNLAAKMAL